MYVTVLNRLDGQDRAIKYLTKMRKLIDIKNSNDWTKLFFIEYASIQILA
jgi:hypothetical protein